MVRPHSDEHMVKWLDVERMAPKRKDDFPFATGGAISHVIHGVFFLSECTVFCRPHGSGRHQIARSVHPTPCQHSDGVWQEKMWQIFSTLEVEEAEAGILGAQQSFGPLGPADSCSTSDEREGFPQLERICWSRMMASSRVCVNYTRVVLQQS